jgi:tripartite-type tricarboxylate transporter receptor subunit TctC
MKAIRYFCIAAMTLGLILSSAERNLAAGPDFPNKPLTVVVGFSPGGTDLLLRGFTDKMTKYLGQQPISFVYKTGASGAIAASYVAGLKPDGYTVFGTTQSAIVVLPHAQKVTFNLSAFTPICNLVESYPTLWVQSDSPWKTLQDVVAEAKKNPGTISFTSPGTYAIQHLMVEAFSKEAGVKLNHIPATGGATVITALLGGHVKMCVQDIVAGLPHFKAGKLRPLGVFNKKRIKALPDTPTISELGYRVDVPMIYGLYGPKEMPKELVAAWNLAARKVLENDKAHLLELYDKMGAEIGYMPAEEFIVELRRQDAFFAQVAKEVVTPK